MAITWLGTAWAVATVYVAGARVVNGGNVYLCTVGGTSAAIGPGPSGTGGAIVDNTCTWAYLGANGGAVVDLAPELSTTTAGQQRTLLAIVGLQVHVDVWGELVDAGQLYLAAHLGSLSTAGSAAGGGAGGAVTSETVGSLSRSYAAPGAGGGGGVSDSLGKTSYGQEYLRLIGLLPSSLGLVP